MAQLANRYAAALFEIALEEDKLEEIYLDVEQTRDIFEKESELYKAFVHPKITAREKTDILEKLFKEKISERVLGLFAAVIHKNRESEIYAVLDSFIRIYRKYKGIEIAQVTSAFPLEEKDINRIKDTLSKNMNKQVEIKSEVDASFIGGVRIEVGGYVIDGTIKNQMDDLKRKLLNLQLV